MKKIVGFLTLLLLSFQLVSAANLRFDAENALSIMQKGDSQQLSTAVCSAPTSLFLVEEEMSATHAKMAWTVEGNQWNAPVAYVVQLKPQSVQLWSDYQVETYVGVTDTFFTFSQLSPLTTYDVRVRAMCQQGNNSEWISQDFTTLSNHFTVSNGTTADHLLPFNGSMLNVAQHTQMLYPASLLKQLRGQLITHLTFYLHTLPSDLSNWNSSIEISIDTTSISSLANEFVAVDQNAIAGNYSSIAHCVRLTDSMVVFELVDPFFYDEKNIVVDVKTNAGGLDYSAFFGMIQPFSGRYSDANGQETPLYFLPKATFSYILSADDFCWNVENVAATDIEPESATIAWDASESHQQWLVQYKKESETAWSEVLTTAHPHIALEGLSRESAYEVRVRAACGNPTDTSEWVVFSFITAYTPCAAPISVSVAQVTDSTALFTWSPLADETNLESEYLFQYKQQDSTSWIAMPNATDTVYRLSSLQEEENYDVRVASVCQEGDTSLWTTHSFTTLHTPCPEIQTVLLDEITNNRVRFSWTVAGDTTNLEQIYLLQYKQIDSINWMQLPNVDTTTSAITALAPLESYSVRVAAVCVKGDTSVWKEFRFTTLPSPCAPPVEVFAKTLRHDMAEIAWHPIADVSNLESLYLVQYKNVDSLTWIEMPSTTDTNYTITSLEDETTYEIKVAAICVEGDTSTWARLSFTTMHIPCATVSAVSAVEIEATRASFAWIPNGDTTNLENFYLLEARNIDSLQWISISNTHHTYTTVSGFQPLTTYWVRVAAVCVKGDTSDWKQLEFTTLPAPCYAPEQITLSSACDTSARISWMSGSDISNPEQEYQFQYKHQDSLLWEVMPNTEDTSIVLQGLDPENNYQARVAAICQLGDTSAWLEIAFATLPTPIPIVCPAPMDVAATQLSHNSAVITWQPVADPTNLEQTYFFQYKHIDSLNWVSMLTTTDTSYALTMLETENYYQVRVASMCALGDTSGWSELLFATYPMPCAMPVQFSIHEVTDVAATLKWAVPLNPTNEPVSYILEYRHIDSTTLISVGGIVDTFFTITDLMPMNDYHVRVAAVCAFGDTSSWAEGDVITSFASCKEPVNVALAAVNDTSAVIAWDHLANETNPELSYLLQCKHQDSLQWKTTIAVADTFMMVTALQPETQYQVRVATICAEGDTSSWSEFAFATPHTPVACPTPVAISFTEIRDTLLSFAWQPVENAYNLEQEYIVQYKNIDSLTWNELPNQIDTFYSIFPLYQESNYVVRVAAVCVDGDTSLWINDTAFTASTPCLIPINLAYDDASLTINSAIIYWELPVENRNDEVVFNVRYRSTSSSEWFYKTGVADTTCTLLNLMPNTEYEVLVKSVCSDINSSAFDTIYLTTIALPIPCPTLSHITCDEASITGTSATVHWSITNDRSNPETQFLVRYKDAARLDWSDTLLVNDTIFTLTDLMPLMPYYVCVKSICAAGDTSEWNCTSFTTIFRSCQNLAQLSVVEEALSDSSVMLTWLPYADVSNPETDFLVEYKLMGTEEWMMWGTAQESFATSHSLAANTTYDFRVMSVCTMGDSSSWETIRVTTLPTPCPAPNHLTYIEEELTATEVMLLWSPVQEPSNPEYGYILQYKTENVDSWENENVETILVPEDTNYWLSGLETSTTYHVRVKAICEAGDNSGWVESQFTTLSSEITVADGTNSNTFLPFSGVFLEAEQHNQFIYPAAMIERLQDELITELTFYFHVAPDEFSNWESSIMIKMDTTSATTLTNGLLPMDQAITVSPMNPIEQWISEDNATFKVVLTTPYLYEGKNLVIDVMTSEGASNYVSFYGAYTLEAGRYSDSTGRDLSVNFLPKANFFYAPKPEIFCWAPSNFVLQDIQTDTVAIAWDANENNTFWNMQYKKTSDEIWSDLVLLDTNYVLIDSLVSNTAYEMRMQSLCQEYSDESDWVYFPFVTAPVYCAEVLTVDDVEEELAADQAKIYWTAIDVPENVMNQFVVEYKKTTAQDWSESIVVFEQYYMMTDLAPATSYDVRVRAICDEVEEMSWIHHQVTTLSIPCPTPFGFSASDDLMGSYTATVSWNVHDPYNWNESYTIQYKNAVIPSWDDPQVVTIANINDLFVDIDQLNPGTNYHVRVQANCASGDSVSAWKETQFATLPIPCPVPNEFAYAEESLTPFQIILTWSADDPYSWNENYIVQYKNENIADWNDAEVVTVNNIVGMAVMIDNLYPSETYNARIQSVCASGDSASVWVSQTFTTPSIPCPKPTQLRQNEEQLTPFQAMITWTVNDPHAWNDSYMLQYKKETVTTWDDDQVVTINNVMGTSQFIYNLYPGTTYQARVKAFCDNGDSTSVWVQCVFTTPSVPCPEPTNFVASEVGIFDAVVTWEVNDPLLWNESYTIQYKPSTIADWNDEMVISATTNDQFYELLSLEHFTEYDLRVKATCANGDSVSNWASQSFTTLPIPCPEILNLQIVETDYTPFQATITWDVEADLYDWQEEFSVEYKIAAAETWIDMGTQQETSITLVNLLPRTDYSIRVRTLCVDNASEWNVYDFATPANEVVVAEDRNAISNMLPVNGASLYMSQHNQMIYPASMLEDLQGKLITKLTFYFASPVPLPASWNSAASVQMSETATSSLSNGFAETNSAIAVAHTASLSNWIDGNLFEIEFATPFLYDEGNLLIDINTTVGASNPAGFWGTVRNNAARSEFGSNDEVIDFLPQLMFNYELLSDDYCGTISNLIATDIQTDGAEISWGSDEFNNSWMLQYKESGTAIWGDEMPSNFTSFTLSDLDEGTLYDVRVKSVCVNGESPWVQTSFETTPIVCPQILAVTDNEAQLSQSAAMITWTIDGDPNSWNDSYTVQYKPSYVETWITNINIQNTYLLLSDLASGTEYDVRVKAICVTGAESEWGTHQFTTLSPDCPMPYGLSADPVAMTSYEATLIWNEPSDPYSWNNGYTVEYKPITISWNDEGVMREMGITEPSAVLYNLIPITDYDVRVRGNCVDGNASEWISATFTTLALPCPEPTDVAAHASSPTSIFVSWNGMADHYNVRYCEVGQGTWITENSTADSLILNELEPSTTYQIQVQSDCPYAESAWVPQTTIVVTTPIQIYTVTATAHGPGVVLPAGETEYNEGAMPMYTFIADENAGIEKVEISGLEVEVENSQYQFAALTQNETLDVYFEDRTAIDENEWRNQISLYPNPATTQITIQSTVEMERMEMFDVSGRKISVEISSEHILQISHLENGIYFIKVVTPEGSTTLRFVKQ